MAEKKTNVLPRLEVIIIIVFFLSFLIWAASRCSRTKVSLQDTDTTALTTQEENNPISAQVDSAALAELAAKAAARNPNPTITESSLTGGSKVILFVVIDDLNLRTEPSLNANEPWLKVRSPKGREGWVYGAGVDYHKERYPGL